MGVCDHHISFYLINESKHTLIYAHFMMERTINIPPDQITEGNGVPLYKGFPHGIFH